MVIQRSQELSKEYDFPVDDYGKGYTRLYNALRVLQKDHANAHSSLYCILSDCMSRQTQSVTAMKLKIELVLMSERDNAFWENFLSFVCTLCIFDSYDQVG